MSSSELAFYINPCGPERRSVMKALANSGIGLIGTDGCTWDPQRDRRDIDAFLADLADFGLGIHSMHAIQPLVVDAEHGTPPDLWDALLTDLQRLAMFGGKTAVYHACWMRDVAPEKMGNAIEAAGWDHFVERYAQSVKRLAQEAAKPGITLVLENVWHSVYSRSFIGFKDILQAVDEPNIGFCLDSGHTNLVEGLSVAEEIRAAGGLLRDTHFHDNVGPLHGTRTDQHIPPGLGTINWQDVCLALGEIAFPGPIVFEGVLGPGDSIQNGRFGGALSHQDLVDITIQNWQAFEALARQARYPPGG
jgi:sugar phosphate isomerase/epimerase